MRIIYFLWGIFVVSIATFLFLVANEVNDREKHLAGLQQEISRINDDIQILRAEWSYLNAPTRLDDLAAKHLGLKPVRPDQYIALDALPFPGDKTKTGDPQPQIRDFPTASAKPGPRPLVRTPEASLVGLTSAVPGAPR